MRIETDRLILRRFTPEDTEAIVAMNADPVVMEHFPAPMTAGETKTLIDYADVHWAKHGLGRFALEIRTTGQTIGFTGLTIPDYKTPANPCVEVGWRLTPSAWGMGYATEAATACLNWGFNDLGLSEIVSFTFEGNHRSRRVMDRLGMHRNKADDFDHPKLPDDSDLLRHVLYRLPKPTP